MDILQRIVQTKKKEVEEKKSLYPVKLLEKSLYYGSPVVSMKQYLQRSDKSGIIAEIKRKSPSKGMINPYVSVEKVSIGYMQAGASALSVLTDKEYFGGSNDDLITARKFNYCPILRKDFIIDEYQVHEARSIGADAILLIAACLTPQEIKTLSAAAKAMDMEVLLEVHDREELERSITDTVDLVGVNNRNLKDFKIDVNLSFELAEVIPADFVKVAESGIEKPSTVAELKAAGFTGFLIGETFMRNPNPDESCRDFIKQLNALTNEVNVH